MQKGNRVNSERIKEARLFRKMTMADLAESVGINKGNTAQKRCEIKASVVEYGHG